MSVNIVAPSPGESISEVQIAKWLKVTGNAVAKDEVVCEIESDKATLTVHAPDAGVLTVVVPEGDIVKVGAVLATVEVGGTATVADKPAAAPAAAAPSTAPTATAATYATGTPSPAAAKILAEKELPPSVVAGTGRDGRITKADAAAASAATLAKWPAEPKVDAPGTRREKMSMLRRSLSERLVAVKNQTAMLTTFNEIDMSFVMALRKAKQDAFVAKFGVKVGFMSFFVKAAIKALQAFPAVNAMIDGTDIIYNESVAMGIAVSAPKGLMVPVIRNAQDLNSGDIEIAIGDLAAKARDGKLSIADMTGGTFTVSNGGVFGSMLSTPIINPPQVAILGMHNIVERPMAVDGQVVIRPIMYVALSYDHRIIDGRESVGFLKTIKEAIEAPEQLLTGV